MEKDNHFMDEELEQDDNKLHLRKFFADKGKFLFHKDEFKWLLRFPDPVAVMHKTEMFKKG